MAGQWFDEAGSRTGGEFLAGSYTYYSDYAPSVAGYGDGKFILVWPRLMDGNVIFIFGKRLDRAAGTSSGEFLVNDYVNAINMFPSVAADSNGDFEVIWQACETAYSFCFEHRRRFDSSGAPLEPESDLLPTPLSIGSNPSFGMNAAGESVVVWKNGGAVFGRRFDADGDAIGSEFQVSSSYINATKPSVSMDAAGGFVVVWADSSYQVRSVLGRRYDSSGSPQGGEFEVSVDHDTPSNAKVSMNSSGDFIVAGRARLRMRSRP